MSILFITYIMVRKTTSLKVEDETWREMKKAAIDLGIDVSDLADRAFDMTLKAIKTGKFTKH